MKEKMPDVIVLLPGITGSELRKNGEIVWGWSGRALLKNLVTQGRDYVDKLWVTNDSPTAERLDDGIEATQLLPDLHLLPGVWKIDGYGAVAEFIRAEFDVVEGENFFPFPYDWRRDNRAAAHRLKRQSAEWLEAWRSRSGRADARLILVAHSMGGLVSRYFLEALDGWKDTRALITFGTPYRGALNAVDAIANGLREAGGIIDLTPLARTLNSLHQLLPVYACIRDGAGKPRRVKDGGIPHAETARVEDAFEFHEEIRRAVEAHAKDERYRAQGYRIYPIVGYRQPTYQSGVVSGDVVRLEYSLDGADLHGDGTVPRISAMPAEYPDAAAGMFAATRHAALQNADAVLTHLAGVLTGLYLPIDEYRAIKSRRAQLALHVEDLYPAGAPVTIRVEATRADVALQATFADVEQPDEEESLPMVQQPDGSFLVSFTPPRASAYRVLVAGGAGVEAAADAFEVVPASGVA